MEKIPIFETFNGTKVLAKLLCFQRNWRKEPSETNINEIMDYSLQFAKDNFSYPIEKEYILTEHLSVFLLGGKSVFDQLITL